MSDSGWSYTAGGASAPVSKNCGYSIGMLAPLVNSLLSMPHDMFGNFWRTNFDGILHGFVPLSAQDGSTNSFRYVGVGGHGVVHIHNGLLKQLDIQGSEKSVSAYFDTYIDVGESRTLGKIYHPTSFAVNMVERFPKKEITVRVLLSRLAVDIVPYKQ
jgi:hypothetical protein